MRLVNDDMAVLLEEGVQLHHRLQEQSGGHYFNQSHFKVLALLHADLKADQTPV
jgi:hypothetical protein